MAVGISLSTTSALLPAIVTYAGSLLILLIADRRIRPVPLTFGLRAFAGRPLPARLREARRELKDARKMHRRLQAEVRTGELHAVRNGDVSTAASS